jgi:hypothetical protein
LNNERKAQKKSTDKADFLNFLVKSSMSKKNTSSLFSRIIVKMRLNWKISRILFSSWITFTSLLSIFTLLNVLWWLQCCHFSFVFLEYFSTLKKKSFFGKQKTHWKKIYELFLVYLHFHYENVNSKTMFNKLPYDPYTSFYPFNIKQLFINVKKLFKNLFSQVNVINSRRAWK